MPGPILKACGRMAAIGALVLLLGTPAGCGRKMPPIAPGAYPPAAVKNITFERQEEQLTLFWTAPAVRSPKESAAVGFKVLRARQAANEAECRTCRPRYEVAGEVRLGDQDAAAGRLQFQERLEPGYSYRYKIVAVSADGLESKDSISVQPTD